MTKNGDEVYDLLYEKYPRIVKWTIAEGYPPHVIFYAAAIGKSGSNPFVKKKRRKSSHGHCPMALLENSDMCEVSQLSKGDLK